jgi:hypothetical protein
MPGRSVSCVTCCSTWPIENTPCGHSGKMYLRRENRSH